MLGPTALGITNNIPGLEVYGQIGIAFLLFILGINLDIKSLKQVGFISVATGLGQITFTGVIGYFLAHLFGFTGLSAFYVATALTFSSTIIIVKLLNDRKEINSLHGRVAIGFLIVQDIVAVLALMFISALSGSEQSAFLTIGYTILQATVLFAVVYLISKYVLPYVLAYAGKNAEVLFVFSIAWCFLFAGFFEYIHFSLEIGALIAGLMLASTSYNYEIASKIKPLRDFFIILFFIVLGSQLEITLLGDYLLAALVFSGLVLIGNPLIVMFIMGLQGFTKRTSFMAGLAVSQISEFGLIVVALGVSVGHVGADILNLATVVALTTILISSYCIIHADRIYGAIHRFIPYYQRRKNPTEDHIQHAVGTYDILLFGCEDIGSEIAEQLIKQKKSFLIIDFDPEVIQRYTSERVSAILADANDVATYELLDLENARIVISTITRGSTNHLILTELARREVSAYTLFCAETMYDKELLVRQGAAEVIVPHMSGGAKAIQALTSLREYKKL